MVTPRQRAREQTLVDITRLGREQLATVGAAQLSVRSIARDLGVVSSAVYRYVKSRDDLLTLLVVDAYDELGEAAEAAERRRRRADHMGRLRAVAHGVRDWALAEPARYALLFGSPVPDYEAPAEQTTGPGLRVPMLLVGVVDDAWQAGALVDPATPLSKALAKDMAGVADGLGVELSPAVMARSMFAWTSLFGAVSFEVFGQYGRDASYSRRLFEHHLDRIAAEVGL
ncbi:TetR/AcrR family transcriptional regulator [Nocardioides mangrovicus]|nr:TetR/AcrR family transcriptional regulator [Nocardioides mangrovicus]